jgi:hypothetical protein
MRHWKLAVLIALLAGCGGANPATDARTPLDPDECSALWNRHASPAARAELGALAETHWQPVFAGLVGPGPGRPQVCFMAYGDGRRETLWTYERDGWTRLPRHARNQVLRQTRDAVYNMMSGEARPDGTVTTRLRPPPNPPSVTRS